MLSACNGKSLDADLLTPKHIPVGKTKECQTDGRLLRKKVFMKTQDVGLRENGNERNIVMYISYALYFIT